MLKRNQREAYRCDEHVPGVPGILTFIDKNIEPLIFNLLWLCKNISAVDNSKKLRHKHKITPRA
jgi:hypothetical protein